MKVPDKKHLLKINRFCLLLFVFLCSMSVPLVFYNRYHTSSDLESSTSDTSPDTKRTEEPTTAEGPGAGLVITLDPGHGGYDPGKIGVDDVKEKDINLAISLYLKEELTTMGFQVYMTREEDISLNTDTAGSKKVSDLNHRVQIVSEHNSDLFISIHQNSFSQASVHGAQVFYYESSEEGKQLAESIQASIQSMVDSENERPIKGNTEYMILKKSPCTAVIVECGFLSNPDECAKLTSADYQKLIASAIANGILNTLQ